MVFQSALHVHIVLARPVVHVLDLFYNTLCKLDILHDPRQEPPVWQLHVDGHDAPRPAAADADRLLLRTIEATSF